MTRAVLADTGPLYAAVDPSDQYHRRAQAELQRLQRWRAAVVVCYPTLLETYTLVLRRLGTSSAHQWLEEMLAGAALVNPAPADYTDAARLVRAYPDHVITLFDAVLAALSDRLSIPVWTYDRHFEWMGTPLWR